MDIDKIIKEIEYAVDTDEVDKTMESFINSLNEMGFDRKIMSILYPFLSKLLNKKAIEKRNNIKRAIETIELYIEQ